MPVALIEAEILEAIFAFWQQRRARMTLLPIAPMFAEV